VARRLTVSIERWPVAGAFTIARGAKTFVDVVAAEIAEDGGIGRGEATPIYYHGETAESVAGQARSVTEAIAEGAGREALLDLLPLGAARNAVDAALWDLAAKRSGQPAWRAAGLSLPAPATTAFTLSLDTPDAMEAAARIAAGRYPLLKLKLAGEGDTERVAAVRRGAPEARLIVDANEAWTGRDILAEASALLPFGVELIEQPVRAGEDHLLDGLSSPIALCADESCQDRTNLARCVGRYAAINVKLDKAGGLTEALALVAEARAAGLEIMVGCMLATSLGIAPAFLLAAQARWIDLDGPLLLARDRPGGFGFAGGTMMPPPPGFWG
jgi:L-alanine-DL-glutamate epimerase-like enolase superfamily enzyme